MYNALVHLYTFSLLYGNVQISNPIWSTCSKKLSTKSHLDFIFFKLHFDYKIFSPKAREFKQQRSEMNSTGTVQERNGPVGEGPEEDHENGPGSLCRWSDLRNWNKFLDLVLHVIQILQMLKKPLWHRSLSRVAKKLFTWLCMNK